MKYQTLPLILAVLTAGGSVSTALGNGMRILSQDGFATARGEAFVATADNPAAIYYNPAGIAQLDGHQFRSGLYTIYFDPTFRPPAGAPNTGNKYDLEKNVAAIPQLFYTHTLENHPLSYGVGLYAPYGLGLSWPQDTGFRSVATRSSLKYLTLNPVVALKLAPNFSIGGGLTANYSTIHLEQGLRAFELPFTNYFRFKGSGLSVGYNLGVLWQPHEAISLGASLRSSSAITMKGRTEFEQHPLIPATHRPAQADFEFPLNAVFGISYRPTSKWNLEFDADYTDWSSFDTVTIRQQTAPPFPVRQNIPVHLNWQPSWASEFGVTRYFNNGWHASAGYVFNENSVPDAHYTPLVADLDRHFFSAGAGHKGNRIDFDFAYQFGYGPSRKVTGSTPSSTPGQFAGQTADGTYGFISHAVIVTVGLHF